MPSITITGQGSRVKRVRGTNPFEQEQQIQHFKSEKYIQKDVEKTVQEDAAHMLSESESPHLEGVQLDSTRSGC